jgi:tripartite-type tricarboxylate transporter receptor subunit TctC
MIRAILSLLMLALCQTTLAALAAEFPTRPVRIVVPFPPGGATDVAARLLGQYLTDTWGHPLVVDNRGGAAGTVGTDIVVRATPDGYTLLLGASGPLAIAPTLYSRLPYDPLRDLAPVTLLATSSFVLAVHPSVPAHSLKEFIALARAKPGKLHFSSSGSGSPSHLGGELLKAMTGVNTVHVPYKGGGPASTALLSGEVQFAVESPAPLIAHAKANRLRPLAVAGNVRSPLLPDVPTAAEAGLPGFAAGSWYGVLAPANTPTNIIAILNAQLVKIVQMPEVKERIIGAGSLPQGTSAAEFAAFIHSEIARWGEIVKFSGAKLD